MLFSRMAHANGWSAWNAGVGCGIAPSIATTPLCPYSPVRGRCMAVCKKPAAPKPAAGLRGVALAESVIAHIAPGKGGIEVAQLRPLSAEVVATLRLANGAPLPPSLRRFLAFDTTWLRRQFPGWNLPALEVATVARLVDRTLGAFAPAFQPLPAGMTPGLALGLDAGSDSISERPTNTASTPS